MSSPFVKLPLPIRFNYLKNKSQLNPLIINYHIVSDLDLPYIKHLYNYRNLKRFKDDIEFLHRNYHLIGLKDLLEGMKSGKALPSNSAMLTFDDGFKEIYTVVAPVLLQTKTPACFFLCKDFIDNKALNHDNKASLIVDHLKKSIPEEQMDCMRSILDHQLLPGDSLEEKILHIPYLKREVLDELASCINLDFNLLMEKDPIYLSSSEITQLLEWGFTIGGHGIDHARFDELAIDQQVDQTLASVNYIAEEYALDYRVFAFPYSDIDISQTYFQKITGVVDATFGTQGMLNDSIANNFQRVSFEKFSFPVKRVLKYHYLRRLIHQRSHKDGINRPVYSG